MTDHLTSPLIHLVFIGDGSQTRILLLDDLGRVYYSEIGHHVRLKWFKKASQIIKTDLGGIILHSKNGRDCLYLSPEANWDDSL